MDVESIQALTLSISIYASYVILIISNIGCIGNFITFTSKKLRKNSCGWYFLISAIFDFLFINFGLSTKIAAVNYGNRMENTSLVWCRLRAYLTWTLPCISTGYVVLASIDRCLSTSRSTRLRSFSQITVAYRMTCIPIILYGLSNLHQLFYYNLQIYCLPMPGIYSYFLSLYSILWTSLIPQSSMLIFGLIAYYNIKKTRQRVAGLQILQRHRIDFQFLQITLFQVLCSSILFNIRTSILYIHAFNIKYRKKFLSSSFRNVLSANHKFYFLY